MSKMIDWFSRVVGFNSQHPQWVTVVGNSSSRASEILIGPPITAYMYHTDTHEVKTTIHIIFFKKISPKAGLFWKSKIQ